MTQDELKKVDSLTRLTLDLGHGLTSTLLVLGNDGKTIELRNEHDVSTLLTYDTAILKGIVKSLTIARDLAPDPDNMNNERAESAAKTIIFFALDFGEFIPDEKGELIRDMKAQNLADLLDNIAHYCDRQGIELCEMLRIARNHYNAETDGEGDQEFSSESAGY